MPVTIYYDDDADLGLIEGKKVAVLGYGSQGHAHALSLRSSGVDVRVGLREGSSSWGKAEAAGLKVATIEAACGEADVMMVLLPDTEQARVYRESIAPHLRDGDSLAFAHGFNIHFGQIRPPKGVDVWMIAPKGPGHLVRRTFEEDGGVPALVAGAPDETGKAEQTALAYARAVGATRARVLRTTVAEMRRILDEIQHGQFAKEWILENQAGRPVFNALRRESAEHPIEEVGERLRSMMPWIGAGKARPRDVSGG